MVVQVHGEVVAPHHAQTVAVYVEHEWVQLDGRVVNHHLHGHVVDDVVLLVAEHEPFAEALEGVGVDEHKRVALNLDGALQCWYLDVHLRRDVGGEGYIGVDRPGKVAYGGEERVDGRND